MKSFLPDIYVKGKKMKIGLFLIITVFQVSFILGQDNNTEKGENLEEMTKAREMERINNIKWYGFKENWRDVKFLVEYFDIDLTKTVESVKQKRPVLMESDFADLPRNIIFRKIEDINSEQSVFKSGKKAAYLNAENKLSIRYYFEQKNHLHDTTVKPFFMTVWYFPTNENAIRAIFDKLTYMNSMGVHQILRMKRIAISDQYKFGDVCFVLPSPEVEENEKRLTFFFVRDGVAFRIERSFKYDLDVVEFARYIDQKFVEISKKLNE
jgi:hypothetical protein